MWQKLKEQIPAIVITAALVIAAGALLVHKVVQQQQQDLAPLRAQNEALRLQADENRQQIAATNKLLKDTLAQTNGSLIPEGQIEKINEERLTRLAEVIAQRVVPAIPQPKSPSELAAAQNEQVDQVADRLAANIRPVLAEAVAEQKAATAGLARNSANRIQQLNVGLLATQAAAQDALKLSREISAMYVDSFKDHGVIMRLFSLPASLVIDAAQGNIVRGDGAKTQRELAVKMDEIEKRLAEMRALAAASN